MALLCAVDHETVVVFDHFADTIVEAPSRAVSSTLESPSTGTEFLDGIADAEHGAEPEKKQRIELEHSHTGGKRRGGRVRREEKWGEESRVEASFGGDKEEEWKR